MSLFNSCSAVYALLYSLHRIRVYLILRGSVAMPLVYHFFGAVDGAALLQRRLVGVSSCGIEFRGYGGGGRRAWALCAKSESEASCSAMMPPHYFGQPIKNMRSSKISHEPDRNQRYGSTFTLSPDTQQPGLGLPHYTHNINFYQNKYSSARAPNMRIYLY